MTSRNEDESMPDEVLTLAGTTTLSDEEVVERVLAGDTALYEVVMRRYNTRLYRAARAILKNDGEAEDVMQDAYVRAFQHLGQFEGRARFSTWLTRIAVHEALARVHKARRFEDWDHMNENQQNEIGAIPLRSNPESETASVEMSKILEQAIENLPDGVQGSRDDARRRRDDNRGDCRVPVAHGRQRQDSATPGPRDAPKGALYKRQDLGGGRIPVSCSSMRPYCGQGVRQIGSARNLPKPYRQLTGREAPRSIQ